MCGTRLQSMTPVFKELLGDNCSTLGRIHIVTTSVEKYCLLINFYISYPDLVGANLSMSNVPVRSAAPQ